MSLCSPAASCSSSWLWLLGLYMIAWLFKAASGQTCTTDLASLEGAAYGRSLLQARSERMPKNQSCSLKSPWMRVPHAPPRHDLNFADYDDNGDQGLFVYPPNNFAFCLIEKNACSTWIYSVMQPLLRKRPPPCKVGSTEKDCDYGNIDWNVSRKSRRMFGQKGIESIFTNPNATRAVFVRDPMERFASAFLNKCLGKNKEDANCIISTRKFKDAVEWALEHDMSKVNPHWRPQADHCQLKTRIGVYNVIVEMHMETFEDDMNCVLEKAGLQRFIKPDHVSLHPSVSEDHGALSPTTVLQKLFPPAVARRLINHMHVDYDVLGFPKEPEWLEGATGEWYDIDPTPMPALSLIEDQQETDHLVALAVRAGYVA